MGTLWESVSCDGAVFMINILICIIVHIFVYEMERILLSVIYFTLCHGHLTATYLPSIMDFEEWKHLTISDITQFAIHNIGDKLVSTCLNVVPVPNVPHNASNKFVKVNSIEEKLYDIIVEEAKREFNITRQPRKFEDLVGSFVKKLNRYLDDALQQRLHFLGDLINDRVKQTSNSMILTIQPILKRVIAEITHAQISATDVVKRIKNSNISNTLKKILSYPVVNEEVSRAIYATSDDSEALLDKIKESLLPFILQEIRREDTEAVNLHTAEAAEHELLIRLIPQYKLLFNSSLLMAKSLDSILEDGKITEYIEGSYAVSFRRAMSIILRYPDWKKYFPEDCNHKSNVDTIMYTTRKDLNLKITRGQIKQALYTKLNQEMGMRHDFVTFDDHPTIIALSDDLYVRCIQRMVSECRTYFKTQREFTIENQKALAVFGRTLLQTRYKTIKEPEVNILKGQITIPIDLKAINNDRVARLNLNIPENILSFQKDLDKEAIDNYGFGSGMFIYSQAYFSVLDSLFPSLDYSDDNENIYYDR